MPKIDYSHTISTMAGLYVHIPFCKRRCIYCDFYSTTGERRKEQYVDTVIAEARHRFNEMTSGRLIETLYLGGGTPSQLTSAQLSTLVNGLSDVFDLTHVHEFTIEVNPDDNSREWLAALAHLGVNRVSMGVQSMDDNELRFMGRRHDADAACRAIQEIKLSGIHNVSVDLIYGIPGQTMQTWRETIDKVLRLGVQHISAYNLTYESGTRLWQLRQNGMVNELDDEVCIDMYNVLVNKLTQAGYMHYEISNFALPGFHSRHNSTYWDGTPYIGLGAAAHSFDGNVRRYNPADLDEYIERVHHQGTAFTEEHLQPWEQLDEMVMLRLRTASGLDMALVEQRFGDEACHELMSRAKVYLQSGHLTWQESKLRIASHAVMMSDAIIRDLFCEQ